MRLWSPLCQTWLVVQIDVFRAALFSRGTNMDEVPPLPSMVQSHSCHLSMLILLSSEFVKEWINLAFEAL